jgi:hypothetical protein
MVYSLSIITANYHYERRIPCRKTFIAQIKLARNLLSNMCAKVIVFIKNVVSSDEFKKRHRFCSTNFSRDRKIPFQILVVFLLNFFRGSYQDELDRFFKSLYKSDVAKRSVTKAALCKARLKLRFQAFVELNHKLNNFFDTHFNPKTWLGFRLLAIDGSTVRLPHTPNIEKHFGVFRCSKGKPSPMARLSQLFDCLNKITVDACIGPKHVGERDIAADHCLQLMPNDLVLLDRGYPAWWLFALIRSMNADFCARISNQWKIVKTFMASGKKEAIVYLPMPATSAKATTKLDLTSTPLKLRMIRIDLDDKSWVLITSLVDSEKYPYGVFSDLYHQRWPVEEDYKVVKCRMELENFTGKTALSVYQDFHAKVLLKNLTAILALPVNDNLNQSTNPRKYDYQVNFTQALSRCNETLVTLFSCSRSKIKILIEGLFKLFQQTVEPVRPGRKNPRNHRIKLRKYYPAYKIIA